MRKRVGSSGWVSRWALAKDSRLGNAFAMVEVEGVRIQRDLLIASTAGPETQGVAEEFRRFLLARTGVKKRAGESAPLPQAKRDKKRK